MFSFVIFWNFVNICFFLNSCGKCFRRIKMVGIFFVINVRLFSNVSFKYFCIFFFVFFFVEVELFFSEIFGFFFCGVSSFDFAIFFVIWVEDFGIIFVVIMVVLRFGFCDMFYFVNFCCNKYKKLFFIFLFLVLVVIYK